MASTRSADSRSFQARPTLHAALVRPRPAGGAVPRAAGDALLSAGRRLRASCACASTPIAIHVDSHEPELTADELTGASTSGSRPGARRTTDTRARAAWQQLADRFDPPRAAWVSRALQPLNPADRPADTDRRRPAAADAARVPAAGDEGASRGRARRDARAAEPMDRARLQERPAVRQRHGCARFPTCCRPDRTRSISGDSGCADGPVSDDQLASTTAMQWMRRFRRGGKGRHGRFARG